MLAHARSRLSRIIAAAMVALAAPATLTAQSAPSWTAAEEAAVRIPLDAYLRGHATGDSTAFRRAFWKEAKLWFVADGALASRTADQYVGGASGRPAADEAQRKRRIVSLQITGTAAVAVIELDYPTVHFIDYMTLLKVGDEWRIINKSFERGAPKAR